jgi:hypothetical protein
LPQTWVLRGLGTASVQQALIRALRLKASALRHAVLVRSAFHRAVSLTLVTLVTGVTEVTDGLGVAATGKPNLTMGNNET